MSTTTDKIRLNNIRVQAAKVRGLTYECTRLAQTGDDQKARAAAEAAQFAAFDLKQMFELPTPRRDGK